MLEVATLIFDAIEKFGGEARFVGGCVRDSIINREVHDIDLATNLIPNQVIKALRLYDIKTIPTGLKHGTVTAVLDKISFEITTLRSDHRCDGRRAKVKFTDDWQLDSSRRDFTFNALYKDKNNYIYDYFNGIKDLQVRRLNFIGNAEDRIKEDYLRILRAFRFHAKVCTENISDEILAVCRKHSHMIHSLSGERIRDEMLKLLECDDPSLTLKSMQEYDILQKIIPKEVNCNILSSEILINSDAIVKLALLIRTIQNVNLGEYLSKFLRFSNTQKKRLLFLLSHNISMKLSLQEQKKYISLFGTNLYCDLLKICGVESRVNINTIKEYIEFTHTFHIPKFPLSGHDLIRLGHQPGKTLGKKLMLIKRYWEENSYDLTKDELISYAKTTL